MYRMGHRRRSEATQHNDHAVSGPHAGSQPMSMDDALSHTLDTDALTGLASLGMLSLRLEDIYSHCEALGIRPSTAFALLMIEPDLNDRNPLVRDAVRVLVADEATRTFSHGETVAVSGSRFIVLAANTAGLPRDGVGMVERLRQLAVLKELHIASWMEPIPDEHVDTNRFVLELAF
jgi:GGDEF domain-containing protein